MLGFGLMELSQSYKNELSGIFLQSRGLFLRIASKIQHAGTGTLSGHVARLQQHNIETMYSPGVQAG